MRFPMVWSGLLAFCALPLAAVTLYPAAGGSNLRVPVIAPVPGGARGNAVDFEGVRFTYELQPHFQAAESGGAGVLSARPATPPGEIRPRPHRRRRQLHRAPGGTGERRPHLFPARQRAGKSLPPNSRRSADGGDTSLHCVPAKRCFKAVEKASLCRCRPDSNRFA